MKKFLLGLAAGFLLAGLACLITFFALVRLTDRRPSIPEAGALVVRLEGPLPEQSPLELPLPLFESTNPMTMIELWDLLRRAERDPRVKALVVEPHGVAAGWGRLQEIREGLARFKRSGKPLYAWLRNPGAREYYLATAADRIFCTREDILDVKGLRAELVFYRRTLDKLGVEVEVEHAGKYKDAADSYSRTSMTGETREVMNSVLDVIYGDLVERVAQARKLTPGKVRASIDEGPFLAVEAKARGLVDDLLYEDEMFQQLQTKLGVAQLARISHRDYLKAGPGTAEGRHRVAFIVGEGTITRGGEAGPFSEESGIRSGAFIRLLRQVADDASIKGAILRINSPGGDAIASDEILHAVRRLSKAKPMVISMSDVAASGGYYIAMTGDPIIAYGDTFTGSIGVIYGKLNLKALYEKLGFNMEVLKRGRNADIDSSARPMDDYARKKLRDGIQHTYQAFLERVSEGRKRPTGEIAPLAEGRVWLGAQAKANGLVDEVGGLDRALELIRAKLKVGADERVRLIVYPRRRSLVEQLFSSASSEAAAETALRKQVHPWLVRMGIEDLDWELWQRGAILRQMPFSVRID